MRHEVSRRSLCTQCEQLWSPGFITPVSPADTGMAGLALRLSHLCSVCILPTSSPDTDFEMCPLLLVFQKDSPQAVKVVREPRTSAKNHILKGQQLPACRCPSCSRGCAGPHSAPLSQLPPLPPYSLIRKQESSLSRKITLGTCWAL